MKARKIISRSEFIYAELLQTYDANAIGFIMKFKRTKDPVVKGIVVKSNLGNHPIGSSNGSWSNPILHKSKWKILTNFKGQE